MKAILAVAVAVALYAACDQTSAPKGPAGPGPEPFIAKGGLQNLLESNADMIGYLNDQEPPYVYTSFRGGRLEWSTDRERRSMIQGRADSYTRPDMSCLGFEYKRLSTPGRAERYLVCEALDTLKLYNVLPRSQDFAFPAGTLFLQYEPPKEIGYPQYFYLKMQ